MYAFESSHHAYIAEGTTRLSNAQFLTGTHMLIYGLPKVVTLLYPVAVFSSAQAADILQLPRS